MVERGLFTEAEPLIMAAQAACPESEGNILTLATVLFNLAGVRFECNRIKETVELCIRVLDPMDPLLGNTFYSAGIAYMEAGNLEEALECSLRAVEIHETCQKRQIHDGSPTALSYLDLGLSYWKRGEIDAASSFIEMGLDLFEETTGVGSQKYGQYVILFTPFSIYNILSYSTDLF